MGIASLVLGIIALVIAVFGSGANFIGSICGILAIIFGALGKKDAEQAEKAKAGLICGIIAVCWGIIATIACVACIGASAGILGSMDF